ncbi:Na+/H+ antiporter family protein [Tissierella sp. Yu-01]|uniref:Na+/H+ antiporter family protein n=1 Tax=Tissierella sp. Yu-01 TaxID=3035694 RepID=UPI00240E91B2|nr:Na+/H+ antiporter family protein [Tissierella sp. Yu-01]WFA09087.1 Na+/H+ antiporter family protein [Tissierella sp. Yu-01]
MLTNPVLIAVLVMSALCLLKVNVLISILVSAIVGGTMAGMSLGDTMSTLIGGMGGSAETALSYILLGALAVAIGHTGVADILVRKIGNVIQNKRTMFVLLIAGIACFSQNLIPVHIAFIPILIPPLLGLMNKLKIDRRAVACALTFGLKAPYVMLPVGFGLIFHGIISGALVDNGVAMDTMDVWKATLLPGIGMIIGLLIAVFVLFRKPRDYKDIEIIEKGNDSEYTGMTKEHWGAVVGAVAAFAIQLLTGSLPLGALVGLIIMIAFGCFKLKELDEMMNGGIGLMGFIAFVMLVASGFGAVLRATGGVEALVEASVEIMRGSKFVAAIVMLFIGLLVTMGIGTSFGTVPIIATIFVPLGVELGFSPLAIASLVAVAGALGDAGSPASDSTLGPTSGLNADGQHDHIWDTCVPTFMAYNIPLIIFGTIAALVL